MRWQYLFLMALGMSLKSLKQGDVGGGINV